eukprot:gene5295-5964_t
MEKKLDGDVLKGLSSKAVREFEELQKKCKDIYSKYTHEYDQNQKFKSQFKQLKRVSLLAVTEYENLMKRYTDETKSKEEVKNKLKKVEEENKELRKANKMAPNVSIIPANSNTGAADASKGELEGLRSLLPGMKEELRRTKTIVVKLESQLDDEKEEHESTKQKLRIGNAQIQQLNKVSVMALGEFQELQKKYQLEVECRRKAEEYASQLHHTHQSEVRTSSVLNRDIAKEDDKLENAFKEIEDLNKTLAKERSEHERSVKDLTEELDSQKEASEVKVLEGKVSVAVDQIEILQSQLQESEDRAQQQERKARDLYERLIRAEAAAVSGVHVAPAPPPPPPPPPPPMPAPVIRKFITRLGGGKKKKDDKGTEKDDPVQDMMKEMMSRIKKGALLRSPQNKEDKAPAMNELADLLTNLRRGQTTVETTEEKVEKLPEFQKFKLRKTNADQVKVVEKRASKDSELMKKLDKQRLAAENEEAAKRLEQVSKTKTTDASPSMTTDNKDKQLDSSDIVGVEASVSNTKEDTEEDDGKSTNADQHEVQGAGQEGVHSNENVQNESLKSCDTELEGTDTVEPSEMLTETTPATEEQASAKEKASINAPVVARAQESGETGAERQREESIEEQGETSAMGDQAKKDATFDEIFAELSDFMAD